MKNQFVILDCETGGKDATVNPITEIAAKIVDPITMRETDRWQTYVQPYGDEWVIEKAALQATQLDLRKIKSGLPYKQACGKLIQFLKTANASGKSASKPILVGHNIGFDIDFLFVLFYLCGKNLWDFLYPVPQDTLTDLKEVEAGLLAKDESSRYSLSACCERLGITLKNAHGAEADIDATHELKKALVKMKRAAYKAVKTGSAELDLKNDRKEKTNKGRQTFYFEF